MTGWCVTSVPVSKSPQGWTYATDFPVNYTKDKKWTSYVRRQRWIRYRWYKSRDVWAKIPSKPSNLQDPFVDISCGGWEIKKAVRGSLSLWAVTSQGKVWFREGIQHHSPEGTGWAEVDMPGKAVQISCGPGDLVWAVLGEGQLLVREGITRNSPKGSSWLRVDPPSPEVGAINVAVGVKVVWAVTKDNKVWFRREVKSPNPSGSHWIGMVGQMVMIHVGLNDQVWGISSEDRVLYRKGVTPSELSGQDWKPLNIPRDSDQAHSSDSSLHSAGCSFSGDATAQSVTSDIDSDSERAGAEDEGGVITCPAPEAPHPPPPPSPGDAGGAGLNGDVSETSSLSSVATYSPALKELYGVDEHPIWKWISGGRDFCFGSASNPSTPVPSVQTAVWRKHIVDELSKRARREMYNFQHYKQAVDEVWGISAEDWVLYRKGVTPSELSGKDWKPLNIPRDSDQAHTPPAHWRKHIVDELSKRARREMDNFQHYIQAVDESVWETGSMEWWCDWKPHTWTKVTIVLDGSMDGILYIYYDDSNDKKKSIRTFINEVTILLPVQSSSKHTFAIYTAERTKKRWPIILATHTEEQMNYWLTLLSSCCCDSRGIRGPPSHQAIWSVTRNGDIFVSEHSASVEASPYSTHCDQMFWRQVGGHLRLVESNSLGVVWGVGDDHKAWVYTGGYGGGRFAGVDISTDKIFPQTIEKSIPIYENQRWNPVSGFTNCGLPTDRYMWSDASGLQKRTMNNTRPPSPHWIWVSDWTIDYGVEGETDEEGWRYAIDFPASYHGHRTLSFVRRRRWIRECKLTTTGPWKEVPPIRLIDVSLAACSVESSSEQLPLWAISSEGKVLCRLGVTTHTPAGSSWLHVDTDQPCKSISVGGAHQVWAIAEDGSAFYRRSVSEQTPAGDSWYHIPSPGQKLTQVSVGRTSIYAVDNNGNLWYRGGIFPFYPQGSSWQRISNNVRKVSVGPLDQVWIISEKMAPGQTWDYGIRGGWDHMTIRGNTTEATTIRMPPIGWTYFS